MLNTRCPLEVIRDNFKTLEANLLKNAISANLRGKFIDYASKLPDADLDGFLKIFNGTSENAIRAWEKLFELTGTKAWVSKSEAVIKKLDADPAKIDKVKDYYNSHTFPEDRPKLPDGSYQAPPFTIKRNVNGVEYNIEYDELGHPKFEVGYASISKREYKPTTPALDGGEKLDASGNIVKSNADYENAAQWFVDNNPNASFPSGHKLGIIVDGKYYTMHHLEDGKTIVPVLSDLHNACAHTGGASVIRKGLQGFFE